jgi:putative endonuclease
MSRQEGRSARARQATRTGAAAEWLAVAWLTLKGWRLIERRHGGKGGEIDLIMRRGRTVAFIEVKARAALDDALDTITAEKRAFISRRVDMWRATNPWAASYTLRADAVFIGRGRLPRHVVHVFELEGL